jgi:molecular chaperone GrpE
MMDEMMNDGKETAANENTPVAPETGPPATESDPLAQAQAEMARLKDQLLRSLAESENMRRRAEREREDTEKYAIAKFAREVLSVADNLHRALENIPADARANDESLNTLAVGVEATERELAAVFERQGIRRIDPLDEKFDPHLHQAIAEVPGTGKPAGTVVQVMRAGYVLHDRLLRPAMVAVAKGDEAVAPHVNTTA